MYAITVQQPWAWAIMHGGKNIENRTRIGTWQRMVGERVAIHSGRRWSERGATSPLVTGAFGAPLVWPNDETSFARGAVIGTVKVEDVHREEGGCCTPWGESSYIEVRDSAEQRRVDIVHLVLTEPVPLTRPIDCRGKLGLWSLPAEVATEVAWDALRHALANQPKPLVVDRPTVSTDGVATRVACPDCEQFVLVVHPGQPDPDLPHVCRVDGRLMFRSGSLAAEIEVAP